MGKKSSGTSIFTRELFSYFNSPIAYIFIVVFVVLINGMYMSQFFLVGKADMRYFFSMLPIALCVFIPAITMRLWAEERKGNTFELLLTFPMQTYKLVLGKFLAGFVFYVMALAGTLFIPVMLSLVGKPDMGPIIGGYAGAIFPRAFSLSGLDFMAGIVDGWLPGVGSFIKTNFGMTRHFVSFQRGVIDNRDILYFVVMTTVFLALNMFSIRSE